MDEAEADAEAVAKAFKNMPDDIKELVASNMDKVPKNGQVSAEWFYTRLLTAGTLIILIIFVQVTVLLFRDGAQLNLYHVLERPDGSYTPLSESLSGSSLRNLFASSGKSEQYEGA